MAPSVKALKLIRASVLRRTTAFERFLDGIGADDNSARTLYLLDKRLLDFVPLLSQHESVQAQLDDLEEDAAVLQQLSDEYNEMYDLVFDKAYTLRFRIESDQKVIKPSTKSITLPTIALPRFSGGASSWLDFRDTFVSVIHNDEGLDEVQKFQYLKSSLGGAAVSLLENIPCTAENYSVAWAMLVERYNDTDSLVNNHLKSLVNINRVSKSSVSSLTAFLDEARKHIRVLNGLSLPVKEWDVLIVYILSEKLDVVTRTKWEEFKPSTLLSTVDILFGFLRERIKRLEATRASVSSLQSHERGAHNRNAGFRPKAEPMQNSHVFVAHEQSPECPVCKSHHLLIHCEKFRNLSVPDRRSALRSAGRCFNCFSTRHFTRECNRPACRECGRKHHRMLHEAGSLSNNGVNRRDAPDTSSPQVTVTNLSNNCNSEVLLSTVVLCVADVRGNLHNCRALLDSGSQSSFVSESLIKRLGLKSSTTNVKVCGLANSSSHIKSFCNLSISPRLNNRFIKKIPCLISEVICQELPSTSFDRSRLKLPNVCLADPHFNRSGKIDLLLGADVFWRVLSPEKIELGRGLPTLYNSDFGYILSGRVDLSRLSSPQTTRCNLSLSFDLQQFWQLDSLPEYSINHNSFDFDKHFNDNVSRNGDGNFVVSIPFCNTLDSLGDSYQSALSRFQALERRFQRDNALKQKYSEFIHEYIKLGHMEPLCSDVSPRFLLPHHGVIKESSSTTRLRVVFDGSCKSTSGVSLNDIQRVGPIVQDDLLSILLRFRKYAFVVSADIAKMYRCVYIQPSQRNTQCILWRDSSQLPLDTYQLNTVTYGTASAPYLATRCLQQLSIDTSSLDPCVSNIIGHDFYVDDLLTGFNHPEDVHPIVARLVSVLSSAGFNLRKWRCNNAVILKQLAGPDVGSGEMLDLAMNHNSKILGLLWNHDSDYLLFKIAAIDTSVVSKRKILSAIAQVFDPLGLLAPCVIRMKVLIQLIWLKKFDWDDPIDSSIAEEWITFCDELLSLNSLQIERRTVFGDRVEVHGFADASEKAYAAVVFVRSFSDGTWTSRLLCSKTRVSPLKTLSIPRLELCASLLLTKLVKKSLSSLGLNVSAIHLWSDSTVVLHWIRTPPRLLNTFVANRVAEIQTFSSGAEWHHVRTRDNPADCASRGVSPLELCRDMLWWHGPTFLTDNDIDYKKFVVPDLSDQVPEQKQLFTFAAVKSLDFSYFFNKFSSFRRMIRVFCWCRRFISHTRRLGSMSTAQLHKSELDASTLKLIKIIQCEAFPNDLRGLSSKADTYRSELANLSPFIDSDGLLRVGGRLKNSYLSFDAKHPILLPKNHKFVQLLFEEEHKLSLHAGAQHLHYRIRERYWVLNGRSLAKKVVFSCIKCFRAKPPRSSPLMGDLPVDRVTLRKPFSVTGIDFAGPVLLKDRPGRNYKTLKSYIAVFVCFSIKAMHLELVSDLTSEAFIAALRRFVARRGLPDVIHCDNGTNFVGANNTLKEMHNFLKNNSNSLIETLGTHRINFKFIAPRSPHLGGLWEAGVKSVKTHVKRTIGLTKLTYEHYHTLLTQIESILNSRPLTAMSADPADLIPLSPSHFLLGGVAEGVIDPPVTHIAENCLSVYQNLQRMRQHFWNRWSREYLNGLQMRHRRSTGVTSPFVGQLVLIVDESTPPLVWPLARITELHPGSDGVCRIVSLRTVRGNTKRAVTKICPLPALV